LLKLYGCEDVVTPVDEDAFGRRSSELIRRGRELQRKQCRDEDQVQCSLSSESSFLRAPRLSAKNRARAMLPPQRPGTKQGSSPPAKKTARLEKLRLEKQASGDAKETASARPKQPSVPS
jgi:hypothetical protein